MKTYTIDDEWAGSRLDRFIRSIVPAHSFAAIQALIRKGKIKVNGKKAKGSQRLNAGDTVSTFINETESAGTTAKEQKERPASKVTLEIGKDIPILYEDDTVLVIDKPRGIPVQPGNLKEKGSLLDALSVYQGTSNGAAEAIFPYTPVHRLDIETTGLLIVAKTRRAARALSRSFREGEIEKVYLAVLNGVPEENEGTISTPLVIEKKRSSTAKPIDDATAGTARLKAKSAETGYRVIKVLEGNRVLVEIRISSGRTHQIRSHVASIGTPVLGDGKYGAASKRTRPKKGQKLYLHAWKLSFPHPTTGERMKLVCNPDWMSEIDWLDKGL